MKITRTFIAAFVLMVIAGTTAIAGSIIHNEVVTTIGFGFSLGSIAILIATGELWKQR